MKLLLPEQYISAEEIRSRVAELGQNITADYSEREINVVSITNGAMLFTSDLIRNIALPLRLDSIMMGSYEGTESTGSVRTRSELKLNLTGRDVLIVDEILDTGNTLSFARELVMKMEPASVKICVLLNKQCRRIVDISADYTGFEIPDEFVIGYGLDYNEYYRNLPYIGIKRDN